MCGIDATRPPTVPDYTDEGQLVQQSLRRTIAARTIQQPPHRALLYAGGVKPVMLSMDNEDTEVLLTPIDNSGACDNSHRIELHIIVLTRVSLSQVV